MALVLHIVGQHHERRLSLKDVYHEVISRSPGVKMISVADAVGELAVRNKVRMEASLNSSTQGLVVRLARTEIPSYLSGASEGTSGQGRGEG